MRNLNWLVAAALLVPVAGCVDSVDQGYGYSNGYYSNGYSSGYSGGYYPSSGYYATPSVSNYYYQPAPTVVTQTRYVPVPTPVPVPARQADRDDHRWSGHRDTPAPQAPPQHVDRPHTPPPQATSSNGGNGGNNNSGNTHRPNGNARDRDGDGKPDHRG